MTASPGEEDLRELAERARRALGEIVYFDVGARDGLAPAWDALARRSLIRAYGFDPAAEHLADLAASDAHTRYLPFALGDGNGRRRLVHTFMPGCSSFLKPNFELLRHYPARRIFEVVGESEVEVRTIDHLVAQGLVPAPHLLKLDTQGSELPILRGAVASLPRVVCIELETQLKPMYHGQALFPEVKEFLEAHGFILRQLRVNGPYEGELLEADAFFSRRPALDDRLPLIRLWQEACGIESPKFLAQMDEWLPEWREYLTDEQVELRERLFGPLERAE